MFLVRDKSSEFPILNLKLVAISRGILPGGNYLWGNFPGTIIQGAIILGQLSGGGQFSSGAIIRGAIMQGGIVRGAIIRGYFSSGAIVRTPNIYVNMWVQLHNLHLLYNSSKAPYHGFDFAYVKKVTSYRILLKEKKRKKEKETL